MIQHIARMCLLSAGTSVALLGVGATARAGTQSTLYAFPGGGTGIDPMTNAVLDAAGNVYGETLFGGSDSYGTLFRYSPATGKLTTLLAFDNTDGRVGNGNVLLSGTTIYAPEPVDASGPGLIFSIQTNGGGYTLLHQFSGTDGAGPQDQMVRAADGTLYGTARAGGIGYSVANGGGDGVIYKIAPNGVFSVLYQFTGGTDGYSPTNIALGGNGTLYGSARYGGVNGGGTVYGFVPATGVLSVLRSFGLYGVVGQPWLGGIYKGEWLFGSATGGGANKNGALFAVKTNGTGFKVLWSFNQNVDGAEPLSPPVLSPQGTLIGTTSEGPGDIGYGTLYEYSSTGLMVLNAFDFNGSDGSPAYPYGTPAVNAAGSVFGTTELGGDLACGNSGCGTIYQYAP